MKTTFKLVGTVLLLALFLVSFNTSLWLIRQPSDLETLAGLVLLCITAGALVSTATAAVKNLLLVLLVAVSATACERIDPGYAGIQVNYYGTERGADDIPVKSGMAWYNPLTESVFSYPTFNQTAQWVKDEEVVFNDKDGLSIGVDVSLSYQLLASKVPHFYVKFRTEDLDGFTHGYMRNVARDAFNEVGVQYSAEDIYGSKKEEFLGQVRQRINSQVNQFGVDVTQFGVVGAMRLPEKIVEALNAKISATQDAQRVENELRKVTAEAQKAVAEAQGQAQSAIVKAEGTAKANAILASSINQTLVEWRRLEVQEKTLWRWNGVMPETVINGQVPMIMPGVTQK